MNNAKERVKYKVVVRRRLMVTLRRLLVFAVIDAGMLAGSWSCARNCRKERTLMLASRSPVGRRVGASQIR